MRTIIQELDRAHVERCIRERSAECWRAALTFFRRVIASTIIKHSRQLRYEQDQIEDLIQEVYVRLCVNECRILREASAATAASVFGLVQAVATTVVLDFHRSRGAAKRGGTVSIVPLEPFHAASETPDPDQDVLISQIDSILKGLRDQSTHRRDCQVFWLFYRHGFTAKDIATLPGVGLSPKGVESVIYRLTSIVRRHITAAGHSKGVEA
jgi:RNA polymerase sigma-70 factor (ECF subfamily)